MGNYNATPFLKWAGGKGQLLEKFAEYYPQKLLDNKIKNYIEPFVGAGAVLFDLLDRYEFEHVVINDINVELMLTYRVIRKQVDPLIDCLAGMQEKYRAAGDREAFYYQVRDGFNEEKRKLNYSRFNRQWIAHAANFIFLNRTCFNGLYRQNRKGEFNVPMGSYSNPTILNAENLMNVSRALQRVQFRHCDFTKLNRYIGEDTFVYIDPPYRPVSASSSFTSYSKDDFGDGDQRRLAGWFRKLAGKGALVMLSNSNPRQQNPDDGFFDALYAGFNIAEIDAVRAINSKGDKRGAVSELVIRNY